MTFDYDKFIKETGTLLRLTKKETTKATRTVAKKLVPRLASFDEVEAMTIPTSKALSVALSGSLTEEELEKYNLEGIISESVTEIADEITEGLKKALRRYK